MIHFLPPVSDDLTDRCYQKTWRPVLGALMTSGLPSSRGRTKLVSIVCRSNYLGTCSPQYVEDYNPNNPVPSHFTQVVWKGSSQVGCAEALCDGIFDAKFGVSTRLVGSSVIIN